MSTATAEPQTEQETVTFLSRSPNQVLTRRQSRHVLNAQGSREELKESDWIEQQHAINRQRELEGKDPIEVDETPWKVQFENHRFTTGHPALIAWLRSHRWLNFNGPSGFGEMEKPVDELEPTAAEQLRTISLSLLHRSLGGAETVLETENETHRRPQVIQAAEAAIKDIEELLDADAPGAVPGDGDAPSPPTS